MEQSASKSLDGFQKLEAVILTGEAVLAAMLQMLSNESDPEPPGGQALISELSRAAA